MKRFAFTRRTVLLIVLPLLAIPLGLKGYSEATWQDPQIAYYNQGLAAYKQAFADGDPYELQTAIDLFNKSIAAYHSEQRASRLDDLLHGGASTELASLAELHAGVALLAEGEMTYDDSKIKQAVAALEESIKLNPGGPYNEEISSGDINRLEAEALPPKYDLEVLFQKHPDQKQGPGKPKPGEANQPQHSKQAPQQNPQNVPGHGSQQGF